MRGGDSAWNVGWGDGGGAAGDLEEGGAYVPRIPGVSRPQKVMRGEGGRDEGPENLDQRCCRTTEIGAMMR